MTTLNRREMVLSGSLAAGLASIGYAGSSPNDLAPLAMADAVPDAGEILRAIHLTGRAETEFIQRAANARSPVSSGIVSDSRPSQAVQGKAITRLGLDGNPIAHGLAFLCDPRRRNRFEVAGVPLVARRFAFSADPINWVPGFGAPVCTAFCPRFDYLSDAPYPEAKCHQLVPMVLGQNYFIGCQPQDICEVAQAGPVCFDVNAIDPQQARGQYLVTIWSWT